jgi:hydrogenase-4 component B
VPELLIGACGLWSAGLLLALSALEHIGKVAHRPRRDATGVAGAVSTLPQAGTLLTLPIALADQTLRLHYTPEALWLMGFGLVPAALAVWLCSPVRSGRSGWLVGAALSLLGALGVYGVQDGYSFLIAWELMSLGGAVMILSERLSPSFGRSALFMLALLEVGAVAIMLALLLLAQSAGGSMDFVHFPFGAHCDVRRPPRFRRRASADWLWREARLAALLRMVPWRLRRRQRRLGSDHVRGGPQCCVLCALTRLWSTGCRSSGDWLFGLGVGVTVIGVLSSILAVLYAFQQDDWRRLLSFSSAENAGIAVIALGASLIFREDGQSDLAGLAWTVALHPSGGSCAGEGRAFPLRGCVSTAQAVPIGLRSVGGCARRASHSASAHCSLP